MCPSAEGMLQGKGVRMGAGGGGGRLGLLLFKDHVHMWL